jgi:solute carrier family 45 protein 1/2/4
MSGIGNILGYMAGNVKLPEYFPWLGGSQFKVLCAIASFIMAITVAISCSTIHERDPRWDGTPETQDGVIAFFKSLFHSVRTLPLQIKRVCEVQFFAWIGWFPFLFYITTYVGEIFVEPHLEENPNMEDGDIDKLWEEATRVGTRALLIFAITTFIASVILPFIIPPTYEAPKPPEVTTPRTPMTPMAPATPSSMNGSGYFALKPQERKKTSGTFNAHISSYLSMLQIQSLTLRRAWMLSHVMFAFLMALTFFIRSTLTATILVAFIGIPWTLTNWAPFALIASEISKRDAIRRGLLRPSNREAALIAAGEDEATNQNSDQAGVVLGIHNVAIAAPQVIATLVSSVIFKMLQKPRGTPGDYSVAWVLRFGGCCAIVAAYLTRRVGEDKEDADLSPQPHPRYGYRRES